MCESTEPPAEQPAAVVDSPVSAGAVVRASLSLSDAAAAAITGDAMVFIIAAQLLVGMLLDHFGAFGLKVEAMTLRRLAGAGLLAAGVFLILRR